MMGMNHIDEIRSRYLHATDSPEAAARFTAEAYEDMGAVLGELERLTTELSAYKQALQNWHEEGMK